jgi:predicted ATPase/DNA-binding XRE family transcriptional regulator
MSMQAAPFAEYLRRHREHRGMTQEELAEAAGLTARGISALERGERRSPYPHTVRALAAALGLSDDEQRALLLVARRRPDGPEPDSVPLAVSLSAPASPLLGRELEIAAIDQLLQDPAVRLLTLTGPGGVGKTRLALRVAEDVGHRFDSVVVVPLASLSAASQVPAAIAQALGLPDFGQQGAVAAIGAALRDQRTLLVLDNFEHVVRAAPDIAELVTGCPGLRVIVTSRIALSSHCERLYPVPPLTVPAVDELGGPGDLFAYPAVRLFRDRARAVDPDFAVDAAGARAVAEICRRLDGLPLAIELAAARTRVLSPAAMLARLASHLDLLTGGPSDWPARQRTVRATVAWSHNLLTADEQAVLRRLSVFVGGFSIEAAEAVVAGPDLLLPEGNGSTCAVLDLVESLVNQSLVLRKPGGVDGLRFWLLESVREFGREQLEASGDAEVVRRRHADWCLLLAERGFREIEGRQQGLWQERLETEHANVRAALAYLREAGDVPTALQLGATVARFWWLRGHYGQGQAELETLLGLPGAAAVIPWGTAAMTGLGMLVHKHGEYERALEIHRTAVASWRALENPAGLLQGMWGSGYAQLSLDPAAAVPFFTESVSLALTLNSSWYLMASKWGLGTAARFLGQHQLAAELLEEGLAVARESGNAIGLSATLQSLGQVERDRGNVSRAAALLGEALEIFQANWVPWGIITCLEELPAIALAIGKPEQAARLLGAAEAQRIIVGQPRPPVELPFYTRTVTAVREKLGEQRFAALWADGQAIRLPTAIALALSDVVDLAAEQAATA